MGHVYPALGTGATAPVEGCEVVCFDVVDLDAPIRAADLEFWLIAEADFPAGTNRGKVTAHRNTVRDLSGRCPSEPTVWEPP